MRMSAVVIVSMSLLTGCASDGQSGGGVDKQTAGTVVGGLVGALAGAQFGKGSGKLAAVAIGAAIGGLLGNQIGASLDDADQAALQTTSAHAIATSADGQAIHWSNPETGASAIVTPKETKIEDHPIVLLRQKQMSPIPKLTLIGETWEAKKTTNVRSSPSKEADVISSLHAGEKFSAIGKVDGADWIVVGKGRRTIGYVSTAFVQKFPESQPRQEETLRPAVNLDEVEKNRAVDLDAPNLVSQEVGASSTCRKLDVNVSVKNSSDQTSLKACKGVDGTWEIL